MKFRHVFSSFLFCTMLMYGCQWMDPQDIPLEEITGVWTLTSVNNAEIPTDDTFVMVIGDNGDGVYAVREDNRWVEMPRRYSYNASSRRLSLYGDIDGKAMVLTLNIAYAGSETMKCVVERMTLDGTESTRYQGQIFAMRRGTDDFSEQIIGLWEGFEHSAEDGGLLMMTAMFRLSFSSDDRFSCHVRGFDGEWQEEQAYGTYKIYNDFIAATVAEDSPRFTSGNGCECWYMAINNGMMSWVAKSSTGGTRRFELSAVEE